MAPMSETQIKKIIRQIDESIEEMATSNQVKSYRIGERTFTRRDLRELRELRQYYQGLLETIPVSEESVYCE